jgi:hypothetical protein
MIVSRTPTDLSNRFVKHMTASEVVRRWPAELDNPPRFALLGIELSLVDTTWWLERPSLTATPRGPEIEVEDAS